MAPSTGTASWRSGPVDRNRLAALAAGSVETILANQAPSGAYPACPSFSRTDSAGFVTARSSRDAVSRAGEVASAEAFFDWCARVLRVRRTMVEELVERRRGGDSVRSSEHPHSRFTLEGDDGRRVVEPSAGRLRFLEEALGEHAGRHGHDVSRLADAVELSARYVVAFVDEPCFDWWEERAGRHTVTLAAAAAGLRAAAGIDGVAPDVRESSLAGAQSAIVAIRRDGARGGRLNAALGDDRLDASLVACAVPFEIFAPDDPLVLATVDALEGELAHGGVHRHAEDTYYGGGEWLLLAALLGAWYYAAAGRKEDAWAQLTWVADRAEPSGDLPEQTGEHLLAPAVGRMGAPLGARRRRHSCGHTRSTWLWRSGSACSSRRGGGLTGHCAIVGGGLAGFTAYATLRQGGLVPDEIAVFGTDLDPAATRAGRAESIRQQRMRSESEGHCSSFPGLAVREDLPSEASRPARREGGGVAVPFALRAHALLAAGLGARRRVAARSRSVPKTATLLGTRPPCRRVASTR